MPGIFLSFVPIQIVTQPGAGRTDPGEKQERKPKVIAVPVEKGAFGAVDASMTAAAPRCTGNSASFSVSGLVMCAAPGTCLAIA